MRIAWGGSRFVVLTKNYAFKFARFRPFWALKRLIETICAREVGSKLKRYHRSHPLIAGLKYLIAGAWANMIEVHVFEKTQHLGLAPTYFTCFGLVNVQRRGKPVTEAELLDEHPFAQLVHIEVLAVDLLKPANFCRIDGKVVLCDYGQIELEPHLLTFNKELPLSLIT